MAALIKLSYEIASGAQVSFQDDTQVNPSASGVSGRISMRGILREYMLSVNPKQSKQIVQSVMALRGMRYPFAVRDYADNYQLEDEEIPHGSTVGVASTVALLGRTWSPDVFVDTETGEEDSGSLSVFERILIPDTEEREFVVKVNGGIPSPASWTFSDFGRINIPGLIDADTVTVTGDYLMAVCYVDAPSTTVITKGNNEIIHRFSDMRFRQIFETELVKLTS